MSNASETKSPLWVVPLLVALMSISFVATAWMFVNAIEVHTWFEVGASRVTDAAIVTYRVLAVVAITFTIAGIVVSFARRWIAFVITNVTVLAFVLLASFVFMVPQFRG